MGTLEPLNRQQLPLADQFVKSGMLCYHWARSYRGEAHTTDYGVAGLGAHVLAQCRDWKPGNAFNRF
jgi:hypothetical protein